MIYIVKINDKEYEVEVERGKANITKIVTVVETVTPVPVITSVPILTSPSLPVSTSGEKVKAPMPGTIIDMKVNLGSIVKKGDVLLILEAMKMENEIVSPIDGAVVQVFVAKNSSVNTDDILVEIQ